MPRCRLNHSEVSATSGAKVAEQPRSPISTPCARLNCQRLADSPASTKPPPRLTAPITTGTTTPNRSESLPIKIPPRPKPIMVSVYGSAASARATPNCACTGGSATTTPYIPAPPSVISTNAAARRMQAYSDSGSPRCIFIMIEFSRPTTAEVRHASSIHHRPGARCLSQARRAHRQGGVRRRLGAQGSFQARPQPGHRGGAHRALPPGPAARPPVARARQRRHARGDLRADHAPRVLCWLAERRQRGADREAGVRREKSMKLGFIGLGAMGAPMAASLQRAGHEVQAHDLRRVDGFPDWKSSPSEAVGGCELVFTSLPGPAEVEAVAAELKAVMRAGTAWFDLSTNSPRCIRRLHQDFLGDRKSVV